MRSFVFFLFFSAATTSEMLAAVKGVVSDQAGRPIANAFIQIVSTGERTSTDSQGRFELPLPSLPFAMEVIHSQYESRTLTIQSRPELLSVVLEPKRLLQEEVTVTARLPSAGFAPVGSAASLVEAKERSLPPSNLMELVEAVPGVAENGQGGLFQVFSVRGVSRQRVLTTLAGARLTSERRAGVSASFLDPLLMEGVDLLRGPASSYYGSGALGGVAQIVPRSFRDGFFQTGIESQGSENYQVAGWGQDGWSIGLARRVANDAETPDGELINSHFTQYSMVIQKEWKLAGKSIHLLAVPALARDIGKANTDFPERRTNYPEEKHLLVQFRVDSENLWSLQGYLHPHDLHTQVSTSDSVSDLFNDTFDFGFKGEKQWDLSNGLSLTTGADYFGRRGVSAFEQNRIRTGEKLQLVDEGRTLDDATRDEVGFFSLLKWQGRRLRLEGGGRLAYNRVDNRESPSVDQTSGSGFVGAEFSLTDNLYLTGSIGSGLRFPSLSERFFSGTTGRGQIVANQSLGSERSFNADVGVRWYGKRMFLAGYLFRNRISDYIERIEPEPDLLTFVNLISGTVRGLEWESVFQPVPALELFGRGHFIRGRDNRGSRLADIPVNRATLGFRLQQSGWRFGFEWQTRGSKKHPGSGEKSISSAQLLSTSAEYRFASGLGILLAASNLLEEEFFNSADRKTPLSPGQSFSIGLRWEQGK